MKKQNKLVWGLAFLPLLLTACGGNGEATSSSTSEFIPSEESVWSTFATAKVIQQASRNDEFIRLGNSVKIEMMNDEKEGGQIILTSKARHTFDFVQNDLVDEKTGNTLPASAVEIFMQRYTTIEVNLHGAAKPFFYGGESIPDFLLPLNYAKSSGENVVEANKNQGFTFQVDSKGVAPGTYKGNYQLVLDGNQIIDIPMEVTIWDFKLDGRSAFQSCWLVYSMYMLPGEYDASEAMMDTYADFLTDYKANPYLIQPKPMNSPEAMMQDVKRLWSNRNFTTITIPYDFQLDYSAESVEGDLACSYIVKLAENSTEEHFYLDHAIFCPSTYDEADMFAGKSSAVDPFFKKGGNYQKTLQKAIQILERRGYFAGKSDAWNARVKSAILAIPNPFTNVNYVESWTKSYPATFCPEENVLTSQQTLEVYKDYAKKSLEEVYDKVNADYAGMAQVENPRPNGNFWTYTCVNPNYPYPSHHIDDDNLSMRELGWMEKSYNINGYLYYMANMYAYENQGGKYCDVYDAPNRQGGANGDGFIMYPGRKYGSPKPFPSTRLVTYRDGLEDYEMLEVYEQRVNELANRYGVTGLEANSLVQDLYNSMFNNAIGTEDHAKFFATRSALAKRILNLKNEDNLFSFVRKDAATGEFKLHVYSDSESLSFNGGSVATTSIGGGHYFASIPVAGKEGEYTLKTAHAEIKDAMPDYRNLTSFTGATNVSVSENSSAEVKDGALNVTMRSVRKSSIAKTQQFHPSIRLENLDLSGAKEIFFDYSNIDLGTVSDSKATEVEFNVFLTSKTGLETEVGGHYCLAPNAGGSIRKHASMNLANIDASKFDSIVIEFRNCIIEKDELVLLPDRGLVIEDIGCR